MLAQVADIALGFLATPVSTYNCERGFSRHNLIKTKTRNCLRTESVENLMHISIVKRDNNFGYIAPFEKWMDVNQEAPMT